MEKLLFLQLVIIGVAAIASQWLAWRFKLPAILFLLTLGFVLGPITGALRPEELLGEALHPLISAAVALILFEGALQLNFREIKEAKRAIAQIIVIGAPIGWALISLGAHYVGGLEWAAAVVLGGMLIVTGPTVVIPMLRHARLKPRVASTLKWESIINDAVGVLFAVLAYDYFIAGAQAAPDAGFFLARGSALVLIVAMSFASSFAITWLFEKGYVPEYLKSPFLLIYVLVLFFLSNQLLYESGLIAVTILGVALTNLYEQSIEEVKRFKETITILLVSGVFILLTAELDLSAMLAMNWRTLAFVLALLFVIRPVAIALSALGSGLNWRETLFMGWIAPRGVVLAVLAGILGPMLEEAGYRDGAQILPIAMTVVIVTVTLDSLIIKRLAAEMKLSTPAEHGLIIVGAHPWSMQLAELLRGKKIPVVIADNSYTALAPVRLANIPFFYGDVLSDEAEESIDLHRYDTLLAASYSPAYNAFVTDTYGREMGRERVFSVGLEKAEKSSRTTLSRSLSGNRWGSASLTGERLARLYEEGWRFKMTRVGPDAPKELLQDTAERMLLGVLTKAGRLLLYSADHLSRRTPKEDDTLILFGKKSG